MCDALFFILDENITVSIWSEIAGGRVDFQSIRRYKTENREKLEPIEEVTIEVNEEHVGLVMEALSHRRAEVTDMGPVPGNVGRTRMSLTCPSRGLVGYRSVFSSDTRGTGFMHRAFLSMLVLQHLFSSFSVFIFLSPNCNAIGFLGWYSFVKYTPCLTWIRCHWAGNYDLTHFRSSSCLVN
ncbi:unnamed protein product [Ilex paraguariensis]|uniref:Elongation factor EFG domain-containing protein n=1 Tax=Ilex paraguariensis TaxID=185542 RepID=A0ABC8RV74_9AQUA